MFWTCLNSPCLFCICHPHSGLLVNGRDKRPFLIYPAAATPARASLGCAYSIRGKPEEHEINRSFCCLFFLLPHSIKTCNSEWLVELLMPIQAPSLPTVHMGRLSRGAHSKLPNIQCHFLRTKLFVDFPSRQHLGEFFCYFLRKGLLSRFFSCPYKV